MSAVVLRIDELEKRVGEEIAVSPWFRITQERIQAFADATDDHQWIHVDPTRAQASPLGGTIAHGFLTLSLLPHLADQAFRIGDATMALNYGLNRLRFTSPVPAGSNVRARFTLTALERMKGAVTFTWIVTVEREGGEKPCLVAEWILRQLG